MILWHYLWVGHWAHNERNPKPPVNDITGGFFNCREGYRVSIRLAVGFFLWVCRDCGPAFPSARRIVRRIVFACREHRAGLTSCPDNQMSLVPIHRGSPYRVAGSPINLQGLRMQFPRSSGLLLYAS